MIGKVRNRAFGSKHIVTADFNPLTKTGVLKECHRHGRYCIYIGRTYGSLGSLFVCNNGLNPLLQY